MLWTDCLRIMSCGLFGVDCGSEYDSASTKLRPDKPEVKYTFAIESSDSDIESPENLHIQQPDYVSPCSSEDEDWELMGEADND